MIPLGISENMDAGHARLDSTPSSSAIRKSPSMNRPGKKGTNATLWIALIVVAAAGETVAFVFAAIDGVSGFSVSDAAERSRRWASAGWWFLCSLSFAAASAWSLFRLLHIIAEQAPHASSEEDMP
jgi:hypothetical protein